MRVGVDGYSYHRLVGWLRPDEPDPGRRLADSGAAIVAEAARLQADGVSLETSFFAAPEAVDAAALRAAANGLEIALAWGAPNGLEFGGRAAPLDDLLAWMEVAHALGSTMVKVSAGGPELRPVAAAEFRHTVAPLRTAAERAGGLGLELSVENHGELTATQLAALIAEVDDPLVGACFDTVNAARVGDDPLQAARLLAPTVRMVHLRDMGPADASLHSVAGPCAVDFDAGTLPLRAILDVFDVAGVQGLVSVQLGQLAVDDDERAMVEAGVAWLRANLGGQDDERPRR